MLNHTFTVTGVSVVLVAEAQNPVMINPDFLKNSEIVPAEWEHTSSISTSPFAHIIYQRGLAVLVDQNRCIFEEKKASTSEAEYQVYECTRKYAEKLEYIYLALGMNWHVTLGHANPDAWSKDRFLRPGEWQRDLNPSTIAFSIPGPDSATCNFTLQIGQPSPQTNSEQPLLLLNCNLDFQLQNVQEKTERISSILQDLQKHESFLRQELIKYFQDDLT